LSQLHDPEVVRQEYESEARLAVRKAAQKHGEGPDAREIAFQAVAEVSPRRILEVGCGEGELAERMLLELAAEVVAVDQSERMVELTRARGVDARLGAVQNLPFEDGEFDCAVAAWMLYHVPDVDRALAELARVAPRLVAVTVGMDHLRELYDLLGYERPPMVFNTQDAQGELERHYSRVERRDASGWITFPDRAAAQAYVDAGIVLRGELPQLEGSLRARRTPCVFVAEK
jgi:SAM-dependent methyltransferase